MCITYTCISYASEVENLFSNDLPELPKNQEVVIITVEIGPGEFSPPHKHGAHTYVYVLEGKIGMRVKGGTEKILVPGDTFYESPDDIHMVSKNMSKTKRAKFLVMFIKTKGSSFIEPLN